MDSKELQKDLHSALKLGFSGPMSRGLITSDEVLTRSNELAEDISAIDFKQFTIQPPSGIPCVVNGEEVAIPFVEYSFGENSHSVHKAKPNGHPLAGTNSTHISVMEGTGLNTEDICYFSRVSSIGRLVAPSLWPKNLQKPLTNPTEHLATLNEVWWLGQWQALNPASLKREVSANPLTKKTVDWQIELESFGSSSPMTINLEVKLRAAPLETSIYGKEFKAALFDKVDGKFVSSSQDSLNILCLTLYCPITKEVEQTIAEGLREHCGVDVVAVWSPSKTDCRQFPQPHLPALKRNVLSAIRRPLSWEDKVRKFGIRHPATREMIQRDPDLREFSPPTKP